MIWNRWALKTEKFNSIKLSRFFFKKSLADKRLSFNLVDKKKKNFVTWYFSFLFSSDNRSICGELFDFSWWIILLIVPSSWTWRLCVYQFILKTHFYFNWKKYCLYLKKKDCENQIQKLKLPWCSVTYLHAKFCKLRPSVYL